MGQKLSNKTAIITGGAGGLGLAVANAFLAQGATCVLTDKQPATDHVNALLESYPQSAHYTSLDVTQRSSMDSFIESTSKEHGGLHILFNNAGLFDMAPLLDSDESMYDRLFAVNVKAMFFTLQTAARLMIEQGQGGKIINLASQAGRRGEALVSHYCATKAAVISYTQSAALALADHRINVNAISPGVVDTPMWDTVDGLFAQYEGLQPGDKKRQVGEAVPLGRMGQPNDIVGAALFLASSDSDYITAQTLNVDGGNVMS